MIRCPDCGGEAVRAFAVASAVKLFEPRYFEHIASKPVFVKSRRHLQDVIAVQAERENTSIRNEFYDIEVKR